MPSICHNVIRDITAQLLTKVCPNVGVELQLHPPSGERFPLQSTNVEDNARLHIRAQNFWDKSKRTTFFDVRVFNSHAPSNCSSSSDACYRRHEQIKVEAMSNGSLRWSMGLHPLFLSSSGGWGPSVAVDFKRLASLISKKYVWPIIQLHY